MTREKRREEKRREGKRRGDKREGEEKRDVIGGVGRFGNWTSLTHKIGRERCVVWLR